MQFEDDEPQIIGNGEPPAYVRRRPTGTGWTWAAICFCCICFFTLLTLVGGILLIRGLNTEETPAPNTLTRCSGFNNVAPADQPQLSGCSAVMTTGICDDPGVCFCLAVPADVEATDRADLAVRLEVPLEECPVANLQCSCTGAGVPFTCLRQTTFGLRGFECTEPLACPFFTELTADEQPVIASDVDCSQPTSQQVGVCAPEGNLCLLQTFPTGSENFDSPTVADQCEVTCAPDSVCTCFTNTCQRESPGVGGVGFSLECVPVDQASEPKE